jgi:hypothetical protein
MTLSPTAAVPRLVVTRVVDYEPPVQTTPECPPGGPSDAPSHRPRHLHAVRAAEPASPRRQAAAAFTDAALRSVLEVIDQRRPAVQLRPLLTGGLADTVVALSRANGHRQAAAVLRRVRLQAADDGEGAFEVAGAYSRGPRLHALACRVELKTTLRGVRWQLVALHIG